MSIKTKVQVSLKTPVKNVRERDPYKVVMVSPDTHARFKEHARKTGYKLQFIADVAIAEFLKRQEGK